MKSNLTKKSLIIGAVLLLVGAAVAFANGGYGGHMMGYGSGYGMGPGMMGNGYGHGGYGMGPGMMGYGPGYANNGHRYGDNLSAEQRTKLDAVQEKFFTETQDLRNKIDDQRSALQEELSKDNPDAAKVGNLQKELSTLQGEFDQKAVQHQIEVRKVLPEDFNGRGNGGNCWQQ
ncbi:MAG: periplasmic heavy metal sensor [Desulfobacterales bacterium]|nr:periplasmic heavy metal sensor [Desulfobacterales bacterium]